MKLLLSFTIGAGAGLLAGILTAPRSGKETRELIVDEVDHTKKALEDAASKRLDEAKQYLNQSVENQAKNSKEAIDRLKETITVQ